MANETVTLATKDDFDALQQRVDNLEAGSNWGRAVFNGTGSQTAFAIEHLIADVIPGAVQVTPGSADAARLFYAVPDDETIVVTFTSAPPSGTGNVVLYWWARA